MENEKRRLFLHALAATVLETDPNTFTEASVLDPWDSLAVVSTIALIDEHYGSSVNGRRLAECKTAADVLALVEA